MSTFQKVYIVVSKIPKGKVMTYGQVAKLTNLNPRVVGYALNANKDIEKIPCHRVVGKNGQLTGYARGGVTKKKEILEKEGVKFINKTVVDLTESLQA